MLEVVKFRESGQPGFNVVISCQKGSPAILYTATVELAQYAWLPCWFSERQPWEFLNYLLVSIGTTKNVYIGLKNKNYVAKPVLNCEVLYGFVVLLLPEIVNMFGERGVVGFCFETRSCHLALEVSMLTRLALNFRSSCLCCPVLLVTGPTATVLGSELFKEGI